ncbi:type II toxin-antitoxin system RelE/ParE family toxin [Ensifer sp. ENS05]|uniref:type II toxin-antitoxin system RelE/ParE family toxin n=1 Tax=Ensifer sp. ENS05 TaxID=2769277 RepID=UPI00177BE5B5|nr:type II toxin-antitoxin system RelE/ParE family toxin [Ensifer sp. ENS05]MBD9592669.1 type II toxin-antitoxin system RelE/ParE family toxin [Ensifer sp. ENS05]
MIEVRETSAFSDWIKKLKDPSAKAKVLVRVRRLSLGLSGDVEPVGEGVSELKIHYGPGYRIYVMARGNALVILLGGGDKSTQAADIKAAKKLAKEIKGA